MSLIPSFFGSSRTNILDPFSLEIWDPFKDFHSYLNLSLQDKLLLWLILAWIGRRPQKPMCSKLNLLGLKKEEVRVEVEDDRVLQISGERKVEEEEKKETWHRVEHSSGKFLRRFRLPENAEMDQVKAAMENDVLIVTVPKVEVKKFDVKSIEISG